MCYGPQTPHIPYPILIPASSSKGTSITLASLARCSKTSSSCKAHLPSFLACFFAYLLNTLLIVKQEVVGIDQLS